MDATFLAPVTHSNQRQLLAPVTRSDQTVFRVFAGEWQKQFQTLANKCFGSIKFLMTYQNNV